MRVLITGAAGEIGTVLRAGLAERHELRGSDLVPCDGQFVRADLCRLDEIAAAMEGAEVVVHLGGIANEDTWERIAAVNIGGTRNVFDAALNGSVRRVIFASSVHAVGFHPRTAPIGNDVVPRPDTFYGVGKVAGEALGRLYAEKYGLEVACLRIASFQARPKDRRHLSTWLSHGDALRLVSACIDAPTLSAVAPDNFVILNAISRNKRAWMDDSGWAHIGYAPVDDAEAFASDLEHIHGPEESVGEHVQGGFFADFDYTGLAHGKVVG